MRWLAFPLLLTLGCSNAAVSLLTVESGDTRVEFLSTGPLSFGQATAVEDCHQVGVDAEGQTILACDSSSGGKLSEEASGLLNGVFDTLTKGLAIFLPRVP